MQTFKEIREKSGMNMKEFGLYFNIPYRTIQSWEYEVRKCPEYVLELIIYKAKKEGILD